ncbi:MAG: hypothetical protein ACETWK_14900 [Candidatus Aminicenantaceae bacterium]
MKDSRRLDKKAWDFSVSLPGVALKIGEVGNARKRLESLQSH